MHLFFVLGSDHEHRWSCNPNFDAMRYVVALTIMPPSDRWQFALIAGDGCLGRFGSVGLIRICRLKNPLSQYDPNIELTIVGRT